jgi:peptidoglycan-associated lipoprotein
MLSFIGFSCSSSKKIKKEDSAEPEIKQDTESRTTQPEKEEFTEAELTQLKKILKRMKDIPFDFDSHIIPSQGLEVIKKDVEILNKMLEARGQTIHITLEGHCDERGSDEYNLALGEQRAKSVKQYLINVGFDENNLKIISYGEERPKIPESNPEAWAANRRVHLVVSL